VLNDLVRKARGEIVVLADARQTLRSRRAPGARRPFADPEVGAVSGELILLSNDAGTPVGDGVGFYWRYEKFLRGTRAWPDRLPERPAPFMRSAGSSSSRSR